MRSPPDAVVARHITHIHVKYKSNTTYKEQHSMSQHITAHPAPPSSMTSMNSSDDATFVESIPDSQLSEIQPSSSRWLSIFHRWRSLDIDEFFSLVLSLIGLFLSVSIGLGYFQTGNWPRDIAVAIYSLTADLSVGAILSCLYGGVSAMAQKGIPINYELLTILSSLEPRTSHRFSELSLRKVIVFLVITLLTFGPDQLVNFTLPQDRQVRIRGSETRDIFLGPIGGGHSIRENETIMYQYSTTGLKFMSETVLAERERARVAMLVGGNEYFLPNKPNILYTGESSEGDDSRFITAVDVPENYGISMNMTTGVNSCDMNSGLQTRGESFGAVFTTSALRIDEYSVTLCSAFSTRSGKVYRADFHLSNRSANVRYLSDGETNRIEQVGPLSNPQPLQRVDQIDLVRHNMTDCFLNMMAFVNAIEKDEDMSSVGIGLVIRAANATNAYGFHGGRGLKREAEIMTGSLVYGGTGVVFWVVLSLSMVRFFASAAIFKLQPVMSGDARQNIAVYSPIAGLLPESFSSRANRQRARELGIPKVIIGFEKAHVNELETSRIIGGYCLRTKVVKGRRMLVLVAGSPEETIPWEDVRIHLRKGEELEIW